MLEVHVYAGGFGLLSMSPYCVHVEAWLRFADIPYKRQIGLQHKSPKKVLPWATDDGALLPTPPELVERLTELTGDRLEGAARATHALVHESLYWAFVYSRWGDPVGIAAMTPVVESRAPKGTAWALVPLFRRGIQAMLERRGLMSQPIEAIYANATQDIRALSAILGDAQWFSGDAPGMLDARVYSVTANVLGAPIDSPLKQELERAANLVAHCARISTTYFPGGEDEQQRDPVARSPRVRPG